MCGVYARLMPSVSVIGWPYDLGRQGVGMALGVGALLDDQELLTAVEGHAGPLTVERVAAVDETLPEMARIFELDRRLAVAVADAKRDGSFPLVLAGNCISCLGTVSGVRDGDRLGIVWLDAHADFDTPDDNLSGFSDVMGVSILTGGSWRALRNTIPWFAPVEERNVVMLGTRDLEPYQRARLVASQVAVIAGKIDEQSHGAALRELAERVDGIYLHVDLDVLDTSVGSANGYAAPGGPDLDTVLAVIRQTFDAIAVKAAALTAYDPAYDCDSGVLRAARQIAAEISRGVERQSDGC